MSVDRPTFHESWYRVRGLRPQLRSTVQTQRQHFRGRRWHVIQDPSNNQHSRIDDAAYRFVGLLDGRRTVEEAWRLTNDQLGDRAPTQGEAINLLGQLYTSNLLRSDLPADAAGMFENYRRRVRREVGGYFMNLLFMRIPIFDPDAILDRWTPLFSPAFGRWGVAVWLALLVLAGVTVAGRADELISGASGVLEPGNLFLLYVCFAVIKALHEFGHGFACKRFGQIEGRGGEVHVMGIMLLVFTPVPYVDASSSWTFRSKWHRAFVGAAGMYVELACAAVAAIIWANTSPGLVHAIAYNVILIASVSTLLFNGNPLLRFDGYYILSDLLEIPNLSKRSRDCLYNAVKKYVYGVKRVRSPARTPGEAFWLPVYAVASTIYRVFIFASIILFVADKFFFIGALFAVASIIGWIFVPLARWTRYLASNSELLRVRGRALATSATFVVAVVLAFGAIPAPDRHRAEGVVEPVDVAMVYAREDGFVEDALPTGAFVTPGDATLLDARNLELETQLVKLRAEWALTLVERNRAAIDEIALAQSLDERLAALDRQIDETEQRLAALHVTAPIAGAWVAPDVGDLRGVYVRRGSQVGLVASVDRLLVRVVTSQKLGPRLEPELGIGGPARIRVKGRPDIEFGGTVQRILPAGSQRLPSSALGYLAGGATAVDVEEGSGQLAAEPFFEVFIDPASPELPGAELWSGQRVVVRFDLPPRPLMVQWWRSLRQLVQRRFQV